MRPTIEKLALSVVFSLAAGTVLAQAPAEPPEKKIHWSLFAGGTYTMLGGSGADTASLSWRGGFTAGGGIEYEFSPRFSLGLEGAFIQKGAKQSTVAQARSLGLRLAYIEFPVLAKVSLAPEAKLRPVLLLGPTIGLAFDCEQPYLYAGQAVVWTNCLNEPERNDVEFGGQAGIELHYGLFFGSARYMYGFTNLYKGESAPEVRNSGFGFAVGVTF